MLEDYLTLEDIPLPEARHNVYCSVIFMAQMFCIDMLRQMYFVAESTLLLLGDKIPTDVCSPLNKWKSKAMADRFAVYCLLIYTFIMCAVH